MRQFVTLLMALLLMCPFALAEEKPSKPALVVVIEHEDGRHEVAWTVGHGEEPTGFRVWGKHEHEEVLLATLPGGARDYLVPAGSNATTYAVTALIGVQESDQSVACVTVRPGTPPSIVTNEDCLESSVR